MTKLQSLYRSTKSVLDVPEFVKSAGPPRRMLQPGRSGALLGGGRPLKPLTPHAQQTPGKPPGPQPFSARQMSENAATAVGGKTRPSPELTPNLPGQPHKPSELAPLVDKALAPAPAPLKTGPDGMDALKKLDGLQMDPDFLKAPPVPPASQIRPRIGGLSRADLAAYGGAGALGLAATSGALAPDTPPAVPAGEPGYNPFAEGPTARPAGPDPFAEKPSTLLPEAVNKGVSTAGEHLKQYWPGYAAAGLGGLALANLVANMRQRRKKSPQLKLAADFAAKHQLVAGFLVKCAEENLSHGEIAGRITAAMLIDADIQQQFDEAQQHPFLKTAAEGLLGAAPKLPTPAAPKLPTMSGASPAPSGPRADFYRAQSRNLANENAALERHGTAMHFFGQQRVSPQGEAVNTPTTGNLRAAVGNIPRAAISAIGAPGAIAADLTTGTGNWDYSKMMAQDLISPLNAGLGTRVGHNVAARPAGVAPGADIGPDEGRMFWGNRRNPTTNEVSQGAIPATTDRLNAEAERPNAEGGTALGRLYSGAKANVLGSAETGLGLATASKAIPALAPLAGPTGMANQLNPALQGVGAGLGAWNETFGPADQEGARQDAWKSPGNPAAQPVPDHQLAQMTVDKNLPPEQKQQAATQALAPLKKPLSEVLTNGPTPEQEAAGQQNLSKQLAEADPESAAQPNFMDQVSKSWGNMDGGQKALMIVGGGLGLLGLINAISGEGGVGSWLMALLGLGGAAATAGGAGMFGEDAKGMLGGFGEQISNMIGGGEKPATPPPAGQNPNIPPAGGAKPVPFEQYANQQLDSEVVSGGRKAMDGNMLGGAARGLRSFMPSSLSQKLIDPRVTAVIDQKLTEKGIDPASIPPARKQQWVEQIMSGK